MIPVTKSFLPPFEEYTAILKRAWDKGWITNNGELLQELEQQLRAQLGIKNLWFTSNGTVVLQMALKVLHITKEVITTPFSYVATSNAILWEGCTPVFVDIDSSSCCIDAAKIEAAITPHTEAILATHVYGIPCDVDKIKDIADKYQLKVIYDGAHAFGCEYGGNSLLSYGDISTCSFHATKVFHTAEGGCIIANDDAVFDQLFLYRQFGHSYDDYQSIGINGKNSELHAAMGLAVLPYMDFITEERKKLSGLYDKALGSLLSMPAKPAGLKYNYAYYPVIFESEAQLLKVQVALNIAGIFPRRYFYPSLNTLSFIPYQAMPVSESIAKRIMCLPLYAGLQEQEVQGIISIIQQHV
jgi:dTDP-4-amino-4,6-dideoxygalactose transaminase